MQKLLIPSSREAVSLNQGQFCTISPIRNLPFFQTHTQAHTGTHTAKTSSDLNKVSLLLHVFHTCMCVYIIYMGACSDKLH